MVSTTELWCSGHRRREALHGIAASGWQPFPPLDGVYRGLQNKTRTLSRSR